MSDQSRPYPSRKQLRAQAQATGSIPVVSATGVIPPVNPEPAAGRGPDAPSNSVPPSLPAPQSRRQRREQERLIETGAIVTVTPHEAARPISPGVQTPQPQETSAAQEHSSAAPPLSAPLAPQPPALAAEPRPLTRRELRERERTSATSGVTDSPAVLPRKEDSPSGGQNTVTSATTESPAVGPLPETAPTEPARPLPPVFGQLPVAVDTHTAPARQVGSATEMTNALILPVAPSVDLSGPIGDTGEVLVTGNIPLPRHVSEQAITGIVDIDDDSDFDTVDTGAFTAPVRATQAVSSRSLEIQQPLIKKPRWGVASLVLGFSAALLGVTALGLLALALLTDVITLPLP